jgi:transcriptional regulator with XRE-family HTH domain
VKLRELREARGLSQEQMAGRVGMTLLSYRKIELGMTQNPRPETIARVAAAVGVPPRGIAEFQRALDRMEAVLAGRVPATID